MRDQITQRPSFEQLHDDVEIAIVSRAKVCDRHRIWVLHASGRPRFTTKPLLGCLVADKSLAEDLQGHRAIDEQVRGPIDRAHPAAAEPIIQTVFAVEYATQKRIERHVCNRDVGLQRRVVAGAHEHIVRKLPTTSRALKHRQQMSYRESA